ncbi:uncharacterized protein EDB91DRAFT_410301 [Suillus paluster]|uniref:uncharacterized protein n=1 Tax=Suillus paluster TaxID=48578 RepID=UPI001B8840D9|nr:uncharacterized protein EDB91DRAFT_410301 [Suillus paluster]KAG1753650.1 hypothetical protein EDB91DRAFT_410301 [Suillus paluster]
MLPEVFNTAPSSPVTDVSSRLMTPLHTDVPANGPDRFCSSPLPTPSPDTPHDESFSMASDSNELNIRPASKLWSWAGSRLGLDGPDRTSSTTSFSATSHSSFHPTLPLSAGLVHNPARASMPPAFKSPNYASSSEYNPAPSHLPSASTLHSTSSTSLPFNHTILRPASNFVPIPPTPPSSSLSSSSAHSDIMHLASPPPTPVFALTRERVAVLRHEDIRGMDCEGPCVDCDTQREHGGHEEYRDKCMDSQEQSPDEETQDHIQSTSDDSSRMCFDMDTSSGEMGSPSRSFEANAEASPHILEAQPEGSGVEPAFEAQDESTIADSSPMCLDADTSSGEVGSPPPSFEAGCRGICVCA